jgi:hypothetical protein
MNLPVVGEVRRYDYQSDIYRRQFKVLEIDPKGNATIELLPLEDSALDAMMADKYTTDRDIEREIDQTGETRKIRFVSDAEWSAMF